MTQIYSETTVERVLDYRQKLFPSGRTDFQFQQDKIESS